MRRYFLDLFSGIGGFALGAQWAGIEFDGHYFSEIEEYAVEVYQKRFPTAMALGDIKNVDYRKLPEGEYIVTAGFPCQPHSVAGKRKASKDKRDLWPECARMLRELRPAITIFENVPGLLISDRGRFFNRVLSDISESGYDAEWQTISASRIGAPHIRNRVWLLCYPNTAGGGSHYWRTPDANMERGKRSIENMKMRIETGKPLNLNDQLNAISKGLLPAPMFPTPRANSGTGKCIHGEGGLDLQTAVKAFPTPTVSGNHNKKGISKKAGDGLETAVKKWATPTANDAKNSLTDSQASRGTLTAHIVETEIDINGGQLNADWVEALMGYPQGWTDLEKEALILADFPAAWLDGSWERGIPRVTAGQKNRIKRLKGLGNAVVPQIPMIIFLLIARAYERRFIR